LGVLQYPSVEETVTGTRGILSETFDLLRRDDRGPAVFAELSELQLYGVSGLHTSGVRAGIRAGAVSVVTAATRLSSEVGSETMVSLAPGFHAGDRWSASVGLVYESNAIEGLASARLVSLTVRSRVRVSETVSVGGEIGRLRVRGEPHDGADVAVVLSARPVPAVCVRAVLDAGRGGGPQPSMSATLHALGAIRLSFGYEGLSDALKGALAIELVGFAVVAGATYHPVLGVRQGISLSWRR